MCFMEAALLSIFLSKSTIKRLFCGKIGHIQRGCHSRKVYRMAIDSCSNQDSINNEFSTISLTVLCDELSRLLKTSFTPRRIPHSFVVDTDSAWSIISKTIFLSFHSVVHIRPASKTISRIMGLGYCLRPICMSDSSPNDCEILFQIQDRPYSDWTFSAN